MSTNIGNFQCRHREVDVQCPHEPTDSSKRVLLLLKQVTQDQREKMFLKTLSPLYNPISSPQDLLFLILQINKKQSFQRFTHLKINPSMNQQMMTTKP